MSDFTQDLAHILGTEELEPEAPKLEVVNETTPLPPSYVHWMRFKPLFASAMAQSPYSLEELERGIAKGSVLFMPGKAAAITAIKATYGNETVLQTTWAVGDMDEILALAPGVEALARLLGCTAVLVEGRRGWEKQLKSLDYRFFSVTLRKEL